MTRSKKRRKSKKKKKRELDYKADVCVSFGAEVNFTAANIRQARKIVRDLVESFVEGTGAYHNRNYPGTSVMTTDFKVEIESLEKEDD